MIKGNVIQVFREDLNERYRSLSYEELIKVLTLNSFSSKFVASSDIEQTHVVIFNFNNHPSVVLKNRYGSKGFIQ